MYTNNLTIPPTVSMDPGFLAAVGARVGTDWLNGGTFLPVDHEGNLSRYLDTKDFDKINRHCKRLVTATDWLIETYSPLCNISPDEWFISVEMFENIGGFAGTITSRLAHHYAGYYQGRGYRVILVAPRKSGALYKKNGNGSSVDSWLAAYPKILCGKRPKYGAKNHLGQDVLLLPNDSKGNKRIHEQATYDSSAYAHFDPAGIKNQAAA